MPRRGKITKRTTPPDPRYNSVIVQQFINKLMWDGKKSTAERIVYAAMEKAAQRINKEPLEVFEQALRNASPSIEVKPRRVGGATYQVPVEVKPDRRAALAMRWMLIAARNRSGRPMADLLANEIADAYNNTGTTIKRREDVHKMAESNRAFAHYGRF